MVFETSFLPWKEMKPISTVRHPDHRPSRYSRVGDPFAPLVHGCVQKDPTRRNEIPVEFGHWCIRFQI